MAADGVSAALAALNWEWATSISQFFDKYVYFLFLLIAVILYVVRPSVRRHRLKIAAFAVSLMLVAVTVVVVKNTWKVARPCDGNLKLEECPGDYAFPSGHTAYVFTYATAAIGTAVFPLFILLGIAVAFSRMYAGVHSLNDVSAGLVIAVSVYLVVENWMKKRWPHLVPEKYRKAEEERKPKKALPLNEQRMFEVRRKVTHVVFGIVILLLIWLLGKNKTELVLLCASLLALTAMHLRLERQRFPLVDEMFELFERPEVLPAKGALMYALGSMLALTFLQDTAQASVAVAILALGDSTATAVGQFGKMRLPWNAKKTWLGAAAFLAFGGVAGYLFMREAVIVPALIACLVETLDVDVDDNLLVPLAVAVWFLFV